MKTIYIAREFDNNSDCMTVSFDRSIAYGAAKGYFDHLTSREHLTHTVALETYHVDIPEDDTRTAQEVYDDMWNDGTFPIDPDEYEELHDRTWGDYFEEHDDENFSWCKPYTDEMEDYWLVIYDGEVEQMKSPTYTTDPVNYERPDDDKVERFAREVNPDYDLYSGWSDTHIALEKMHETGCAHCPWFDECQAMGETMHDGDCR